MGGGIDRGVVGRVVAFGAPVRVDAGSRVLRGGSGRRIVRGAALSLGAFVLGASAVALAAHGGRLRGALARLNGAVGSARNRNCVAIRAQQALLLGQLQQPLNLLLDLGPLFGGHARVDAREQRVDLVAQIRVLKGGACLAQRLELVLLGEGGAARKRDGERQGTGDDA